jgi:hypothetical protein
MTEADLQAVLYTLRGHNFQNAFKNGRSAGNGAHVWKGTTSRVMVARRFKVTFCPDGNTGPGNYGYHLILVQDITFIFVFIICSQFV